MDVNGQSPVPVVERPADSQVYWFLLFQNIG